MAFFFDMDNPAVRLDEDDDKDEFEVELHNGFDMDLDIMLVYDAAKEEETWEMVFDEVIPNETTHYSAYEGDLIRVLRSGTDEVVTEFEIVRDQYLYTISLVTISSAL